MRPPVIFLPEHRRGHGLGHFSRAATLVAQLGERAFIYLPPGTRPGTPTPTDTAMDPDRRGAFLELAAARGVERRVIDRLPRADRARRRLFVVDRRTVTAEEVRGLRLRGAVVALDAAGSGRPHCDYLIDVLPRVDGAAANVRDLRLLELPPASPSSADRRAAPQDGAPGRAAPQDGAPGRPATGRVLVTFGGDDPRGITARVVAALLSTRRFAADDIDVLLPGLSPNAANATGTAATAPASSPLSGVRVIRAPLDLRSAMAAYETVVTSFGLTAFEAAWVGADVLLVNASRYHARLARRAGFRSVAVGRPSQRRLVRLFARRIRTGGGAERVRHRLAGADSWSLASLIDGLAVPQVHDCPACGASDGRVLGRFECRTYVRCGDCDMIYLRCFEEPRDYPADYFFDEYRRQYGRTYLEDAPHIKAMGHRRLGEIERAMPRRRPAHARLIDLGCAYGPFLSASAERGYAVVGVDVSETAVSHIRSELGFPAFHMHLEELASTAGRPRELESGGATVVTMWYVIEHLPKLEQVLAAVRELLGSDGVFAFSTPNRVGISGRRSIREFLRRSPQDHYTVWSPRTARRVLARHGFRVRRIRITGHHPERFPGASRLRTGGTARRIVLALSRVLKLGDTFEVYAVKRGGGAR